MYYGGRKDWEGEKFFSLLFFFFGDGSAALVYYLAFLGGLHAH
jgi:hypothetical protein